MKKILRLLPLCLSIFFLNAEDDIFRTGSSQTEEEHAAQEAAERIAREVAKKAKEEALAEAARMAAAKKAQEAQAAQAARVAANMKLKTAWGDFFAAQKTPEINTPTETIEIDVYKNIEGITYKVQREDGDITLIQSKQADAPDTSYTVVWSMRNPVAPQEPPRIIRPITITLGDKPISFKDVAAWEASWQEFIKLPGLLWGKGGAFWQKTPEERTQSLIEITKNLADQYKQGSPETRSTILKALTTLEDFVSQNTKKFSDTSSVTQALANAYKTLQETSLERLHALESQVANPQELVRAQQESEALFNELSALYTTLDITAREKASSEQAAYVDTLVKALWQAAALKTGFSALQLAKTLGSDPTAITEDTIATLTLQLASIIDDLHYQDYPSFADRYTAMQQQQAILSAITKQAISAAPSQQPSSVDLGKALRNLMTGSLDSIDTTILKTLRELGYIDNTNILILPLAPSALQLRAFAEMHERLTMRATQLQEFVQKNSPTSPPNLTMIFEQGIVNALLKIDPTYTVGTPAKALSKAGGIPLAEELRIQWLIPDDQRIALREARAAAQQDPILLAVRGQSSGATVNREQLAQISNILDTLSATTSTDFDPELKAVLLNDLQKNPAQQLLPNSKLLVEALAGQPVAAATIPVNQLRSMTTGFWHELGAFLKRFFSDVWLRLRCVAYQIRGATGSTAQALAAPVSGIAGLVGRELGPAAATAIGTAIGGPTAGLAAGALTNTNIGKTAAGTLTAGLSFMSLYGTGALVKASDPLVKEINDEYIRHGWDPALLEDDKGWIESTAEWIKGMFKSTESWWSAQLATQDAYAKRAEKLATQARNALALELGEPLQASTQTLAQKLKDTLGEAKKAHTKLTYLLIEKRLRRLEQEMVYTISHAARAHMNYMALTLNIMYEIDTTTPFARSLITGAKVGGALGGLVGIAGSLLLPVALPFAGDAALGILGSMVALPVAGVALGAAAGIGVPAIIKAYSWISNTFIKPNLPPPGAKEPLPIPQPTAEELWAFARDVYKQQQVNLLALKALLKQPDNPFAAFANTADASSFLPLLSDIIDGRITWARQAMQDALRSVLQSHGVTVPEAATPGSSNTPPSSTAATDTGTARKS